MIDRAADPVVDPVVDPEARSAPRALASLRAAVALLTRLPVGAASDDRSGAAAFPVAGLLVGLFAALPVALVGPRDPTLAAVLCVAVAALVTGALHLDGLADTADALLAPDRPRAEAARKDPAVGAGGVVALVVVVGVEVAAVAGIVREGGTWLATGGVIAAATVARVVPVIAVRLPGRGAAGRGEGATADLGAGFGAWFAARVTLRDGVLASVAATVVVAALAVVLRAPPVAIAAAVGLGIGLLVARWLSIVRGRLDGDGLGAAVELTVAATLAVLAFVVAG